VATSLILTGANRAAAAATTRSYAATGGLTSGGAAAVGKTKAFAASGGQVSSGSALTGRSRSYAATAAGGFVSGGLAGVSKAKSAGTSGGLTSSGVAAGSRVKSFAASGGIASGGGATVSKLKSFNPSGGLALTGVGEPQFSSIYTATVTGGATFAGASSTLLAPAGVASDHAWLAVGGRTFGGSSASLFIAESGDTPVEQVQLFGGGWSSAASQKAPMAASLHTFAASGGKVFGGEAECSFLPRPAATRTQAFAYEGGGSVRVSIRAEVSRSVTRSYEAAGGRSVRGEAAAALHLWRGFIVAQSINEVEPLRVAVRR
jgi:hypothetical protein